ncbi:hypothetical protein ACH61_00793 [Rathayibacter tanaceti]|uniref:Uncharacterized protein n=1 Tax=Rathayibacter tanaceti TaxID=1671680 RepID=A0A166IB70_9MICO|nr:hypothetical protein ACH61_00793 [Rathayibacter tanaceti]
MTTSEKVRPLIPEVAAPEPSQLESSAALNATVTARSRAPAEIEASRLLLRAVTGSKLSTPTPAMRPAIRIDPGRSRERSGFMTLTATSATTTVMATAAIGPRETVATTPAEARIPSSRSLRREPGARPRRRARLPR